VTRLRDLWPDIRELIDARRGILGAGLVLILIGRTAGLVLPWSTKIMIDDVLGKSRADLLGPLALAVLIATIIQAATDFSLTQLLSKSGQALIADMRRKV